MRHRVLPRLAPLIAVAWASPTHADDFTGRVVGVTDRDTLTVLRWRTPVKVRLHGIDDPAAGSSSA
jgi:endonuclease YncB( thermonuclease family)